MLIGEVFFYSKSLKLGNIFSINERSTVNVVKKAKDPVFQLCLF
jgi:hypothetical protein